MSEFWSDYTVRVVVFGSALIGAVSGALGCYAYLRRQSLIGDVVAHSSLLGIVSAFWGAFLLTGSGNKSLWVIIPGAIVAGLAALLLTRAVTGLTSAGLTSQDLWLIGLIGAAAVITMLLFWSRLKILTFDPEYAAGLGLPVRRLELLLLCLMVIGIVVGLQIAGVVLMISLLVAPAAAASQWTHHLGKMVGLASTIGAICAAGGALLSAVFSHLPTGPVIVALVTLAFVASVLCSPSRGLLFRRRFVVD